jgi:DnaJ-class molecular chaperone
MAEIKDDCPKCHGTRKIMTKDGTISICFQCLTEGRMEQHGKTQKTEVKNVNDDCPKCHGERKVTGKDGTIGPCFQCLTEGRMEQHSKTLKDASDFGIRL